MASEAAGDGRQEAAKVKVFISYSRKDMAFADRLDTALQGRNFEPLIDRTEIYAFEDWWARIQSLIAQADTVIFVLSPDSVGSDVCGKEVAFAASLNKRFAPIVFQRVDDKSVPEALSRLNFIFFDQDALFDASFSRLCDALHTNIDWIRKHTEYGEAARRWESDGRPGGLLLRSPVLEEAERWIASRPPGAPAPTETTQTFITESRRGASRRRNVLTGSLAAGLVLALGLAGLAYWQRGIAVEQRKIAVAERQVADQQRKRAENTLALATQTANSLVFDLTQEFRDVVGVPSTMIENILDRALKLQGQLLQSGETSPDLLRGEAVALGETARTLLTLGKTDSALADAEKARDIFAALVKQKPSDTGRQRDLAASYDRLGDVQEVRGNLPEAAKSYQASLAIMQHLAQSDPGNEGWQRDLSIAYEKVGDVQEDQRNFPDALKSYQADLAIAERLAKSASGDAQWQRDLSVSYARVGNAQVALLNLTEAMKSYQAGLAIGERLAQSDPGNAQWQDDVSVFYEQVGDVQEAQGNLPEALKSFQASLAIRERLTQSDPGNAGWQRNLAISYAKLATVYEKTGDTAKAQDALAKGRAIIAPLVAQHPDDAQWKKDLAWFDQQIAAHGNSTSHSQ